MEDKATLRNKFASILEEVLGQNYVETDEGTLFTDAIGIVLESHFKNLLLEARKETAQHIKDICPITDGASADRLHSRIDNYLEELQEMLNNG